jgi:hypothetical protein
MDTPQYVLNHPSSRNPPKRHSFSVFLPEVLREEAIRPYPSRMLRAIWVQPLLFLSSLECLPKALIFRYRTHELEEPYTVFLVQFQVSQFIS